MDLRVKQNWRNFLELFLKSGMTKADYCRSQKMHPSKFYYYAKLHREAATKPLNGTQAISKQSNFVPMAIKKDFKIKINDSITLSFEAAPDASWMASFIKSFGISHATI